MWLDNDDGVRIGGGRRHRLAISSTDGSWSAPELDCRDADICRILETVRDARSFARQRHGEGEDEVPEALLRVAQTTRE